MKILHLNFVFLIILSAASNIASGQDKVFLQCDGSTKVGSYADSHLITNDELRAFSAIKPMSLRIIIENSKISVDGYEYKNIPQRFAKENFGTSEHGSLEMNASSYDGYYFQERDRGLNGSTEKSYYFYQQSRIQLNRLNGDFIWWITYYGNSSWINDLMPVKAKDKYLKLEVTGKCRKADSKALF